jgi:transcriptional regulator with XRE-family HTH domain
MDQIKALARRLKLATERGTVNEVADSAGVERSTVRRVRDGRTKAPSMATYAALLAAVDSLGIEDVPVARKRRAVRG